jgi:pimeloyl-ACP methyl ester carboxylesterase
MDYLPLPNEIFQMNPKEIKRFALICSRTIRHLMMVVCFVFMAMANLSCDGSNGSTPYTETQMWGVFKTDSGAVVNAVGEESDFTTCNEGYRSTASNIELHLWTVDFIDRSLKAYDTPTGNLIAEGTVKEDALTLKSVDGEWAFTASYRKWGCCFDGTDASSTHWHGIRMPDYNDPTTIGEGPCDFNYTTWLNSWTNQLYSGSSVVDTQAGPVEYAIIGESGPVIAFMHGGPGDYYSALAYFQNLLGQGFRFLTWSRPGFLRTPLSTGTTPESQADALAALLDTLAIDSVAMLGASAGGPPAYQFAIRHPERTWALVAVDAVSQAYAAGSGEKPGEETWIYLLTIDSGMWLYNAMFEYAHLGTTRQFIGMMSTLDDVQNDALAASVVANETKLEMLGNVLLSMSPNNLLMEGTFNDIHHYADMPPMPLEQITTPTLIVHGTADGDVPPDDAINAASKITGAELCWVEGGVHVVTLSEDSDVAMGKVLDFLKQHSPE